MVGELRYEDVQGDDIGPQKVLHVHDPRAGLEAVLVVDNVAAGPAIGGVRMAPDLSVAEVARLARAMTLKNAAAGLPQGGGKAGIRAAPRAGPERELLVRAFARAIAEGLIQVEVAASQEAVRRALAADPACALAAQALALAVQANLSRQAVPPARPPGAGTGRSGSSRDGLMQAHAHDLVALGRLPRWHSPANRRCQRHCQHAVPNRA